MQNNQWDKKLFEGDPGDQACSEKPSHRHKFVCLSVLIMTCRLASKPMALSPVISSIKILILVRGRLVLWKNCSLHDCLHYSSDLRNVWVLRAHWWVVGDIYCACELQTREWLLGRSVFCLAVILLMQLRILFKNVVCIVLPIIFNSYANKYSDATHVYEWQRK